MANQIIESRQNASNSINLNTSANNEWETVFSEPLNIKSGSVMRLNYAFVHSQIGNLIEINDQNNTFNYKVRYYLPNPSADGGFVDGKH